VLVGWDFAHGYPVGFCAAAGLGGGDRAGDPAPWRRVWAALAAAIADGPDNANNRWDVARTLNRRLGRAGGPFWNCPAGVADAWLPGRRPAFPHPTRSGAGLAEYRVADRRLRAGGRRVQSVWKLYTTGSVGSQTLLGIPVVSGLRDDPRLAADSRVWPFETGFAADPTGGRRPRVVHAEMWPGVVPLSGRLGRMQPRDRAQVLAMVRHLAARDAAGMLGALLDRPAGLGDADVAGCLEEEGWILGA
jgi:hypothetical protein